MTKIKTQIQVQEAHCSQCDRLLAKAENESGYITRMSKGKNGASSEIVYSHGKVLNVTCCNVEQRFISHKWEDTDTLKKKVWTGNTLKF